MNTTSSAITLRDLLNAVISGDITEEIRTKAQAEIAKLDATNAKRAERAREKAKENLPIKQAIFDFLVANGTKTTAEIAKGVEALEGSTSKASAICLHNSNFGFLAPFSYCWIRFAFNPTFSPKSP